MQSSGQQPTGETEHESAGVGNEIEQASSPLYEFPADSSLLEDAPQSAQVSHQTPGDEKPNQPSWEAIQQGLVYPPPPSFYQNMQVPLARPGSALPSQPVAGTPAAFYSPGTQRQPFPAGVQVPPFAPAQFPGMQPPVKKSYKWVWIVVSIFAVSLLITGGLCTWAFYNLFNATFQQESGSMNVVNDYFQHMQNRGYANAYSDLQINGLTQDDFIAKAQASDAQNGLMLSFVVEQPTFVSNPGTGVDLSQWRYTVDVKRVKSSYPVLLTVQNIGGSWKITYFDRI